MTDFYAKVLLHMEECINSHWNSEEPIDKKVRLYFEKLKVSHFTSSKYFLMMVDMCADQFYMYDISNNNLLAAKMDIFFPTLMKRKYTPNFFIN